MSAEGALPFAAEEFCDVSEMQALAELVGGYLLFSILLFFIIATETLYMEASLKCKHWQNSWVGILFFKLYV